MRLTRVDVTPVYTQLPKGVAYLSLMAAPCLDDFTIISSLGDGSSGTVYIARENDTGGLYALKAILKRKPCGKELRIDSVMTERDTLLDLRGDDFILQLRACFHDSRNYYLVTVRDAIFKRHERCEPLTYVS
jgi:serine/threonine protein kinase